MIFPLLLLGGAAAADLSTLRKANSAFIHHPHHGPKHYFQWKEAFSRFWWKVLTKVMLITPLLFIGYIRRDPSTRDPLVV